MVTDVPKILLQGASSLLSAEWCAQGAKVTVIGVWCFVPSGYKEVEESVDNMKGSHVWKAKA